MRFWAFLIFGFIACLLTGCATMGKHNALLRNHDDDYLQSKSLAKINVPKGVYFYPADPYYTIPVYAVKSQRQMSLLPPGSLAAQQAIAKSTGRQHAKG